MAVHATYATPTQATPAPCGWGCLFWLFGLVTAARAETGEGEAEATRGRDGHSTAGQQSSRFRVSTDTIPTPACNELAVRRRGLRGTAITGTSPGSGIRGSLAPSVRAEGNSSTAHGGEYLPRACFNHARRARTHQAPSPLPQHAPSQARAISAPVHLLNC